MKYSETSRKILDSNKITEEKEKEFIKGPDMDEILDAINFINENYEEGLSIHCIIMKKC